MFFSFKEVPSIRMATSNGPWRIISTAQRTLRGRLLPCTSQWSHSLQCPQQSQPWCCSQGYIHTPTFVSCPCFITSKTVLNNHVFNSYNKLIKNLTNSPSWVFLSNHFFLHVNFNMHAWNSKCFIIRKSA